MIRIFVSSIVVCLSLMIALLLGCDLGEKKTTIIPITQTSSGSMLVLFSTASTYNGNLGGRAGADALCAASTPAGVTNVHAFISIAPVAIADMPVKYGYPTNLPIYGKWGTSNERIADDWPDLLDGMLNINLFNAGMLPADDSWWSNSYSNGTEYAGPDGCYSFTSNSSSVYGMVGYSESTASDWILNTTVQCDALAYVLCIGVK